MWRARAFRASASFGIKLNLISLLTLLFEPLVKFAFSFSGGPTQVAYYELASRIITQIRGLVVAASIPLIPAIASLGEADMHRREELLNRATTVTSFAAIGAAAVSICLMPFVSFLVLGSLSERLVYLSIPLIFAWSIHLPSVPIYLAAQTDGRMRWNVLSHLILALAVLVGLALSNTGLNSAVLVSVVVGLILSAGCVFAGNIPMLGIKNVAVKSGRYFVLCVGAITALSLLAWYSFYWIVS
jgi:O-antigen/teichoic acid export membrane protein